MAKWTLYFLLQWLVTNGHAQLQQPYFSKLNTENGLSNNKVKCILQDKRGFTWIGTEDGLNRFDGTHFVIFRHQPSNPSGLSGNIITDLQQDSSGILWIATEDGGLNRYDYRLPLKDQFRQFKHIPNDSNSIPVNFVNALLEDRDGYLWLATSGASVLRFNKKTEKFDVKINVGRTLYDLNMDPQGIIWAGRQGGSILKFNPRTLHYEVQKEYDDFYRKLPHVVVTSIFKDHEGNMWFGSWDKALYQFNPATGKETAFADDGTEKSFGDDEAISFNEDAAHRLWIGGKEHGLYLYDRYEKRFYNFRNDPSREGSLAGNAVNCIYIDPASNVWLGTNSGVSMYNTVQQQFIQNFLPFDKTGARPVIYDFLQNGRGETWIGTSQGLFIKSATGKITHHLLRYNNQFLQVTRFFKDVTGEIYIGTDYSLFLFDTSNYNVLPLPNMANDLVMKKLIESRIVAIVRDTIMNNPVLAVSPYGHFIAWYDMVRKEWVSRLDSSRAILNTYGIKDNLVRKMIRSCNGEIWMANLKEGLGRWPAKLGEKIKYYVNDPQKKGTISNNNVYDIEENGENFWVSTYGGGLNYFNRGSGTFTHITESNNLLEGMRTDSRGNVWMISNGNLHKYDTADHSYTSFSLPDVEKSGGVKGYVYKSGDGNMYVAGSNYYISFHPDSIKIERNRSSVIFTDFKIFDNSYNELLFKNRIVLSHNQNFFTVEFSAPNYANGGGVEYSYMLEGVDKSWVKAGSRNFASYSNVSGGVYPFKVRASTNSEKWSEDLAMITIKVIPPFWVRWWFYAICMATAGLIVYGIYRYRVNELIKRQTMRNKIAQDLHDSVGSTLSSISIYSQVARIQNQQHNEPELDSVLDKIGITSNEMISEMNDIVWTINPRNDNMEKIMQRMDSFSRPLLTASNIQFHFDYQPEIKQLNLDMTQRKNLYLIFKEAINNVIKYSQCKNVWVKVFMQKNQLLLTVKDDGIGFDAEKIHLKSSNTLSGNGLRNMNYRASEVKGRYSLESMPGEGTTVNVAFPLT